MTPSVPWPRWLTEDQFGALQKLDPDEFTWAVRTEPASANSVIYGQWAQGLSNEVNVVLRAPRNGNEKTSFAGVYPRGQGFWQGGREPALVTTALQSKTGAVVEVLSMAEFWSTGGHL
jgi:hypothetical protein